MKLNIIKPITDKDTIEEICKKRIPNTWETLFEKSVSEIAHISNMIAEDEKIYEILPGKQDIFRAFEYTKYNKIKVVIVGEAPYHKQCKIKNMYVSQAMGLSYSVRNNIQLTDDLKNIFTELQNIDTFCYPESGDLKYWAIQGVLLLNMSLTTRNGQHDAHGEIWYPFINKAIKEIKIANSQCVFMLWGRKAQEIKKMFDNNTKFLILEASDPKNKNGYGFLGCNHFTLANEHLLAIGIDPIDWNLKPDAWKIPNLC